MLKGDQSTSAKATKAQALRRAKHRHLGKQSTGAAAHCHCKETC